MVQDLIWEKRGGKNRGRKGNTVSCVIFSSLLFFFFVVKEKKKTYPGLKGSGDNGVISSIRKSSGGLWVGCSAAHSCLFVLPHFTNQQPGAP